MGIRSSSLFVEFINKLKQAHQKERRFEGSPALVLPSIVTAAGSGAGTHHAPWRWESFPRDHQATMYLHSFSMPAQRMTRNIDLAHLYVMTISRLVVSTHPARLAAYSPRPSVATEYSCYHAIVVEGILPMIWERPF
jgi:hypothetical protein